MHEEMSHPYASGHILRHFEHRLTHAKMYLYLFSLLKPTR